MTLALDIGQLAALQQLSSPALPIGGFSYSQGLEAAVELRLVYDEDSARVWIQSQLETVMAHCEAPVWLLLYRAWRDGEHQAADEWNQWFLASRETRELRQETEQMGASLARLVHDMQWCSADQRTSLAAMRPMTLPLVHACVCAALRLPEEAGLAAYLFTWLENQVAAAIKSVPLGQSAGQRIITGLRPRLQGVVANAQQRARAEPPALHTFAPQYAIVSSRHETQFSRLFRS
ncbi:urease accessory protein UreF [Pusillimonas sp. TS35]|uniref:urease accessory protein UreF n=1 Tax=Paracandidimonas lactea TaxID=2895524 RepID=UPI00136901AB|nr:urease accessory protein UreF [Paracandidimonas lactea]MYN14853.1 urease accessory protein UreF [Pusillimonas sp. TS35]